MTPFWPGPPPIPLKAKIHQVGQKSHYELLIFLAKPSPTNGNGPKRILSKNDPHFRGKHDNIMKFYRQIGSYEKIRSPPSS